MSYTGMITEQKPGRCRVTLIPDIEPPDEKEDLVPREVHRFKLPEHFDRDAVQAECDRLEAKVSFTAPFESTLALLFLCPLLPAIVCVFFAGTRHLALAFFVISLASFVLVMVLERYTGRLSKERAPLTYQLHEYDKQRREMEHGLRAPDEFDDPVDPGRWKPSMTRSAEWAFGEERGVLPDDVVVKFSWAEGPTYGRGGYAIRRGGKIVAEYTTWMS